MPLTDLKLTVFFFFLFKQLIIYAICSLIFTEHKVLDTKVQISRRDGVSCMLSKYLVSSMQCSIINIVILIMSEKS